MLHRARDKEWANSLVWRDRVESFTPQLSEGNICVLANERCLFCDGGNRLPAAVRGDSLCHGPSKERDRDGGEGEEGGGVIPVSNPAAETERESPAFYGLETLPPPVLQSLRYCGLHICLVHFKGASSYN